MIIIFGIGNYGNRYSATRHNVGVSVVKFIISKSQILEQNNLNQAELFLVQFNGHRGILGYNKGFMNNSGSGVKEVFEHYKELGLKNLCVCHDDMDLPLGRLKLRFNGGSGGHKGINSVETSIGSSDFWRLKIGISKPSLKNFRPTWILQRFSEDELSQINLSILKLSESVLTDIFSGHWERAQNIINSGFLVC